MLFVSDIDTLAPSEYKTPLQKKTYQTLQDLHIPFQRVDTDEVIKMDDCVQINKALQMKMVKTLLLCNRKQDEFYLFVTTADKPFRSKEFSSALGIPRVSFAPAIILEGLLGTKLGATTIFSLLLDEDNAVKIILDQDVFIEEWYGCSDGTTTGYLKLKTEQIVHEFLRFTNHSPIIIQL